MCNWPLAIYRMQSGHPHPVMDILTAPFLDPTSLSNTQHESLSLSFFIAATGLTSYVASTKAIVVGVLLST